MTLVKMSYRIDMICRVCMEESKLTSIYSTEFAVMPLQMLMSCCKIKIFKSDGLPNKICYNCVLKLQAAYRFKEECENADKTLREYLNLPEESYGYADVATNTEIVEERRTWFEDNEDEKRPVKKRSRRSRYTRIPQEQQKKRGPKPTTKMPLICEMCNKSFKSNSQLQSHMRIHTGEKPFRCTYCPRSFAQKHNLEIHERTHTGDRPFQCEVCSKRFSTPSNFRSHLKTHIGVRDFDCAECGKGFYTATDLERHMYRHEAVKEFSCEYCDKSFVRQRDLSSHQHKKHPTLDSDEEALRQKNGLNIGCLVKIDEDNVIEQSYYCPECSKELPSLAELNEHYRTHDANNLLSLSTETSTAENDFIKIKAAAHRV